MPLLSSYPRGTQLCASPLPRRAPSRRRFRRASLRLCALVCSALPRPLTSALRLLTSTSPSAPTHLFSSPHSYPEVTHAHLRRDEGAVRKTCCAFRSFAHPLHAYPPFRGVSSASTSPRHRCSQQDLLPHTVLTPFFRLRHRRVARALRRHSCVGRPCPPFLWRLRARNRIAHRELTET